MYSRKDPIADFWGHIDFARQTYLQYKTNCIGNYPSPLKLFRKFICFGSLMRPFDQLNVMYINWWMIGLIELISCRISLPSFPGFPEVEVRAYVPHDRAGPYYGHVHILHAPPFRQNPFAPHTENSYSIGLSFCQQPPVVKKTGPQNQGFQKPKQKSEITFQISEIYPQQLAFNRPNF